MIETDFLKEQARDCRANARSAKSPADRRGLMQMAAYYDREAARLIRDTTVNEVHIITRQSAAR